MKYIKKALLRLWYLPFGVVKTLIVTANNAARDMENKKKYSKAIIDRGCCMTSDTIIGNHSHILENCIINHSKIGKYTYISRKTLIQNTTIGNYCSIAHEVISGLGSHPINLFSTSPVFYRRINPLQIRLVKQNLNFEEYKPIYIGNDVWIGARAIIMDGVTIGNGAIIAAGAVVTKNVEPYSIVGGVPAKLIKYRTSEDKIEEFTKSDWWDLDPSDAYQQMSKH